MISERCVDADEIAWRGLVHFADRKDLPGLFARLRAPPAFTASADSASNTTIMEGAALVDEFARRFAPAAIFERAGLNALLRDLATARNVTISSGATDEAVIACREPRADMMPVHVAASSATDERRQTVPVPRESPQPGWRTTSKRSYPVRHAATASPRTGVNFNRAGVKSFSVPSSPKGPCTVANGCCVRHPRSDECMKAAQGR